MPYKIRKKEKGFKVCKLSGKCFSKKPLTKKKAKAQMAAIQINSSVDSVNYFERLIKESLNE
jgi:hypothetical protein